MTDNARARARLRGVRSGVPDLFICQASGRSLWLELKWGDNDLSDAQLAVKAVMDACDIPRWTCWLIGDVLRALRAAGFALHPNADNLAVEYQVRAEAAVAKAEGRAGWGQKVGPGKARVRSSLSQVARGNAFTAKRLGLLG